MNFRNLLLVISVSLFLFTSQKLEAQSWSAVDKGINDSARVFAFGVYGGNLFAGGEYDTAGGIVINSNCAAYNGTNWIGTGDETSVGQEAGFVYTLAAYNGDLYAAGIMDTGTLGNYFVAAALMTKWNGTSWAPMDSDIYFSSLSSGASLYTPFVSSLAVYKNNLYMGGIFGSAGGVSVVSIAEWNGKNCSAVGGGINAGGTVDALTADNNNLYAGGLFDTAGGNRVNNIAEWNGTSWSALGSGVNGRIWTLAVNNGNLYVGGQFDSAGGQPANGIAMWNGTNWSALGSGVRGNNPVWGTGVVLSLTFINDSVYAGGSFDSAGGTAANNIAEWNGKSWSKLGSGLSGANGGNAGTNVWALTTYNGNLYAGGAFDTAGGLVARGVAEWGASSGINQLSVNNIQFSIYPNPSSGSFTITSSKNIDEIKVTNLLGQLMYEAQPKQTQFNFELNNAGMYFVTATCDGESVTDKVVVAR